MYRKKNDLNNLINSFSKAEKRYLFTYLKGLDNKETPIYQKLLKQSKSAFSKLQNHGQTYTKAKKRLYHHLMRCLLHYHQEKSTATIIQNQLCQIEILYDRGLADQSVILLKKAYALALSHEHYSLVLQILDWERRLNIILDRPTRENKEIAREEKKILDNFNQIIELENIYSAIREIKKRHGHGKESLKEQLENIAIKNPNLTNLYPPSSQKARYYYHVIYCLYYFLILDIKESYKHSKKLLMPNIQRVLPKEYLEGILHHTTSCMNLGYFDEMQRFLQFASVFVQQKKFAHFTPFLLITFYYQSCYTLVQCIYTGAIKKLLDTIKTTEEKLSVYDEQLSTEWKIVIYANLRNACIAAGDLDKAEVMLNKILQMESGLVRSDVFNDIFLSRVFSFLSSGTYVLVPAMALSAHRRYGKQTGDMENQLGAGLKITAVLMKEYDYNDPKVRKSVLSKVKRILRKYIASLKGLNNFHEIYSFYEIWTDSLLEGRPFHVVAADWHNGHLRRLAEKDT